MDKEDGMVNTRLAFYFVKIRVQRKKSVTFDNATLWFKNQGRKIWRSMTLKISSTLWKQFVRKMPIVHHWPHLFRPPVVIASQLNRWFPVMLRTAMNMTTSKWHSRPFPEHNWWQRTLGWKLLLTSSLDQFVRLPSNFRGGYPFIFIKKNWRNSKLS